MRRLLFPLFIAMVVLACNSTTAPQLPTLAARADATATTPPTPRPTIPPTNTPACRFLAAEYVEEIDDMLERWDDTYELALSTSRIALSGPLADLQEIKRDAGDVDPPQCAREAHNALIYYMEKEIDVFLSFMADDSDAVLGSKIRTAESAHERFLELWSGLQ